MFIKQVKTEVLKTSQNWIACFNLGSVEACSNFYLEDAIMDARPFGRYEGATKKLVKVGQPYSNG